MFDFIDGQSLLADGQQALSVDEVKYETNALYAAALNGLREKGVEIQSIVCDGRKGLLQMFPEIPAQLC